MNELREKLAALCHDQWSGWMEYLFSKCVDHVMPASLGFHKDGELLIPKEFVDRWRRQMKTPYLDLSEEEKESDRKEADKFLELLSEEN